LILELLGKYLECGPNKINVSGYFYDKIVKELSEVAIPSFF
jgi:hypothetical protein